MSGRHSRRERGTTPSPPKSQSQSQSQSRSRSRRPLHARSQSEINEGTPSNRSSVVYSTDGQENSGLRIFDDSWKLPAFAASPFPTSDLHILRPGPSSGLARRPVAGSVAASSSPDGSPPPMQTAHETPTAPPVITDTSSTLRSDDDALIRHHDDSVFLPSSPPTLTLDFSSTNLSLPDPSLYEAGLVAPSSTIRLVADATPSPDHGYDAMTDPSLRAPFAGNFQTYHDPVDYSPSISDLPTLPSPDQTVPSTPTPATRSRPTIRAITDLSSELTVRHTPPSTRSANSSGTQVHHQRTLADEPPPGSYLHFADRPRSSSVPSLLSSSPIVRRLNESPSSPVASPLGPNRRRDSHDPSQRPQSPGSPDSGRFPALDRYLAATGTGSDDGQSPSTSSPASTPRVRVSSSFRPVKQLPRSNQLRWSSRRTLSTIPSQSEQSSVRLISADASQLLDAEASLLSLSQQSTHPSIRLVQEEREEPDEPSRTFDDPDMSNLSLSMQSAQSTHPSIRLVTEGDRDSVSVYDPVDVEITPNARQSQTPRPANRMSSPAWVSYSSPVVQLPHIANDPERQGSLTAASRTDLSQLTESSSSSSSGGGTPSRSAQEVINPTNSSHVTRMPYRRRSIRTGSPFFTPGRNAIPRQSTVGHAADQQGHGFDFNLDNVAQGATSSFEPSPDPNALSPLSELSPPSSPEPSSLSPSLETSPYRRNRPSIDWQDTTFPPSAIPPRRASRNAPTTIPFPVASSVNPSPQSIHIPRSRPQQTRNSIYSHSRNRTLGSTVTSDSQGPSERGSSRRSSSPGRRSQYYYDYEPSTPQSRPVRPSNPTPGTTPGATPATNRTSRTGRRPAPYGQGMLEPIPGTSTHLPAPGSSAAEEAQHDLTPDRTRQQQQQQQMQQYQPSLRPTAAAAALINRPMSFPVLHTQARADWSPHLWHDATKTIARRSAFLAPSVDSTSSSFLSGAKAGRDVQLAAFVVGFVLPITWIVASFLPLPACGDVRTMGVGLEARLSGAWGGDGVPLPKTKGKSKGKGKAVFGADVEKEPPQLVSWTADEVAGFEAARWWRVVNRCLASVGLAICLVLIIVGVVTSKGAIQTT